MKKITGLAQQLLDEDYSIDTDYFNDVELDHILVMLQQVIIERKEK